ncbi:MAG: pentapeptide repeat-containing protein, partial [Actinomycetota bacterium]|nr:pentapeptide repeat-containing protein [Actinomycetota bacterium]
DFRGAVLDGLDLSSADFDGDPSLYGTALRGVDLSGRHLGRMDLRGANLATAVLEGTDLSQALVDDNTRWPEGFDPAKAGVTG